MKIEWVDSINKGFGGKSRGLHELAKFNFNIPHTLCLDFEFAEAIIRKETEAISKLEKYINKLESDYVAVRSSGEEEDGEQKSFAGVFKTELNVVNSVEDVAKSIRVIIDDSQNNSKISSYFKNKVQMNIVIQEMIDSVWGGVCFTRCEDKKGRNVFCMEFVNGSGDKLVSGHSSSKTAVLGISRDGRKFTSVNFFGPRIKDIWKNIDRFEDLLQFDTPKDVEWCIDSRGHLYFLQLRNVTKEVIIDENEVGASVIVEGVAEGEAYVLTDDSEKTLKQALDKFKKGQILVAKYTDTEYLPIILKSSAILTEEGAILSHAATIARELGVTCAVGINGVTQIINTGDKLRVDLEKGIIENKKAGIIGLKKRKVYNQVPLFDYEKVIEVHDNNTCFLVEFLTDSIALYCDSNLDECYIKKIKSKLTGKYDMEVIVCQDNKYLWYFEYKRFMKSRIFREIINAAKNISKELDRNKLSNLYNEITNFCVKLAEIRDKTDELERFYINEIIISCFFVLDLYIPCGGGILEIFMKILEISILNSTPIEDFFSGKVNNCGERSNEIVSFIREMTNQHNRIWNRWVDLNLRDYDFFENRDIEIEKISRIYNIENRIDAIYNLFNDITELRDTTVELFNTTVTI